jgi:hypothetical protein
MRATVPETIVKALEIRGISAHDPSTDPDSILFADVHDWRGWVLKVNSDLDQEVTLTLYGNLVKTTTGAGDYPDTLTVGPGWPAGEVGYITFHATRSAWTPWIYCSMQCAVAPTNGGVTVSIVKFDRMRD